MEPRLPPFDESAEESCLGSILLDSEAILKIPFLIPEDFYRDQNRIIYATCLDMSKRREAIDSVSVAHALGNHLENIGGAAYLLHLLGSTPTPLHVEHYARIVKDCANSRRLIAAGEEIQRLGYEGGDIERAEDLLSRLRKGTVTEEVLTPQKYASGILEMVGQRQKKGPQGMIFGLPTLDKKTGGMQPGTLTIVAARPGLGKTTFLLQVARANAQKNKKVLFASVEMSKEGIAERDIALKTAIPIQKITMGELDDNDWDKIAQAAGEISEEPLYLKTGKLSASGLETFARQMAHNTGLDLLVIDYLQLLADVKGGTENERVGYISHTIKHISSEVGCAVLCASQLSRKAEYRDDKRPMLSDLRDSGVVEQDADMVLGLHRDDTQGQTEDEEEVKGRKTYKPLGKGVAELAILKHRQWGVADRIRLVWLEKWRKYGEML